MQFTIGISTAIALFSYLSAPALVEASLVDIISDAPPEVLANSPAPRCTTYPCTYYLPTPTIRQQLFDTFISKHLTPAGATTPSASITLAPNTTICVVCNGGVLKYEYERFDGSDEGKELSLQYLRHDKEDWIRPFTKKRLYSPEGSLQEGWSARLTLGIVEEDWVTECAGLVCPEEGKAGEWTEEDKKWLYTDPYSGDRREL